MQRLMYVARDGNYGDAAGLTVVDVTDWTEDDWIAMDEARDADRIAVAQGLSQAKH